MFPTTVFYIFQSSMISDSKDFNSSWHLLGNDRKIFIYTHYKIRVAKTGTSENITRHDLALTSPGGKY